MKNFIYVSLFGVMGVLLRYGVGLIAPKFFVGSFPVATLIMNLLGSFAIGVFYVLGVERAVLSPELRVGLMVGLLGGFTTFSAYSLESVRLIESGQLGQALMYVLGSAGLGLLGCYGGMQLARLFVRI